MNKKKLAIVLACVLAALLVCAALLRILGGEQGYTAGQQTEPSTEMTDPTGNGAAGADTTTDTTATVDTAPTVDEHTDPIETTKPTGIQIDIATEPTEVTEEEGPTATSRPVEVDIEIDFNDF